MSKTMRVTDNAYEKLEELSEETGFSKQDLIDRAIEELSRKLFFKKVNKAYSKLRSNPKEWEEELQEREEWESINDQLDDE